MDGDTLVVPRAEFSIEEPWAIPGACRPVDLLRSTDGTRPRLATRVAVYRDKSFLPVVFAGQDDGVVATHLEHDAPLWQEDVMEIFIAPADLKTYFEIEVNPLGTSFDARIVSPEGVRQSMSPDLAWTCNGLLAAVRRTPSTFDLLMRFPFESLGVEAPRRGSIWRANLFRVDHDAVRGDEYSAWRPTMKTPADFHVTAAFGRFEFA
ncbi:MAG TPA: carbohydrate-binding family 9-like protein [Thermoanaerobaculia bacterium]|nr:carbohydrate-binding family 9-like protein [Thermoanaerobaculia bacterium]